MQHQGSLTSEVEPVTSGMSEIDLYLRHTVQGQSIRSLAREIGVHPSTVLRRVRKLEAKRDDPMIDQALENVGFEQECNSQPLTSSRSPSPEKLISSKDTQRFLRRLNETGAFLALASDMENAVIMRSTVDGQNVRSAIIGRSDVQALALNEWIALTNKGLISRYEITPAGRKALRRLLAGQEQSRFPDYELNAFAE